MASSESTFVTGYIDLAKIENSTRRNSQTYLHYVKRLFALDINLIVFIESAYYDFCKQHRSKYIHKTKIYVIDFTDLKYYQYKERMHKCRQLNPITNSDPIKGTVNYVIVNWSKMDMIERAMNDNPFQSTHFGWIDFGLTHIALMTCCQIDQVFEISEDRIRLMALRKIDYAGIDDLQRYLQRVNFIIAMGYFTGHIDNMRRFVKRFEREAMFALQYGHAVNEEQLIPLIHKKYPKMFSIYYGTYKMILSNYKIYRGCLSLLTDAITYYNSINQYEVILDEGINAFNSIKAGYSGRTKEAIKQFLLKFYITTVNCDTNLSTDIHKYLLQLN